MTLVKYDPAPQTYLSYLDVCEPMDVEALTNHAIDGKTIHVLINNAGLSMRGAIEDTPIKIYKQLMDVNFFGHVVVTQKLLDTIPDDGCIIATSSVQGKLAIPYRSAYSASKHAFQVSQVISVLLGKAVASN
ncbi:short chain dehydrogenase domain protein [Cooperia oncophora]